MSGTLMIVTLFLFSLPVEEISGPSIVRIGLNDRQEAEVADIVEGLGAQASGVGVRRPEGSLKLPMTGLGGPLSKALLADVLGADVSQAIEGRSLVLRIPANRMGDAAKTDWYRRLGGLVARMRRRRSAAGGITACTHCNRTGPATPTGRPSA